MDWIFYSAVMFVGSVVYYLLVKKVQDLGVDRYLYMATTSIVPAIAYALIGLIDGQSFIMSPLGFLIIFINAAFLNYFGSITGFIGIKTAPNAGYSVIIQKSYAIYTSILAVFLFDSELPFYKVLAILIILFFTGLIVIERSNEIRCQNWRGPEYFFILGYACDSIHLDRRGIKEQIKNHYKTKYKNYYLAFPDVRIGHGFLLGQKFIFDNCAKRGLYRCN